MKELEVNLKLKIYVSTDEDEGLENVDLGELRNSVFNSLENERVNGCLTIGNEDVSIESFDLDLID